MSAEKYVMQSTREEGGLLTFHLIPPLTDWHPVRYAGMVADLVTHIAAYTGLTESDLMRLIQEDLKQRMEVASAVDKRV